MAVDSLSKKRIRVYADTSVFGGCYDDEFSVDSRKLFDEIVEGKFLLVISEITLLELGDAPPRVREILTQLPLDSLEMIEISEEILALRDAYLDAEVLGGSSIRDATHVAAGSVADVDMIVSWNSNISSISIKSMDFTPSICSKDIAWWKSIRRRRW